MPVWLLCNRCGTAALVSFAYGAIAEPDSVSQLPQALTGIACLLAGMTGIAAAGTRQQAIEAAEHAQPQHQHQSSAAPIAGAANSNPTAAWMQQPLLDEEHYVSGSDPTDVEASSVHPLSAGLHAGKASGPARAHHSTVKGLVLAVLTGLFGGLILAPMDHVGHECRGLPYQASLAAGVLFAAPVGTYCIYWMRERKVSSRHLELAAHQRSSVHWCVLLSVFRLTITTSGLNLHLMAKVIGHAKRAASLTAHLCSNQQRYCS